MGTIKSFTSLEQSKELAEILPPGSADMCYRAHREECGILDFLVTLCPYQFAGDGGVPCWSLAALLDYLREIDFFPTIEVDEHSVTMSIIYYDEDEGSLLNPVHNIKVESDDFIDACYGWILKLKEKKLL